MPLNNFYNSDKDMTSQSIKKLGKVRLVDIKLAPGKLWIWHVQTAVAAV